MTTKSQQHFATPARADGQKKLWTEKRHQSFGFPNRPFSVRAGIGKGDVGRRRRDGETQQEAEDPFPEKKERGIGEPCLLEASSPQSFIQLPSLCRPLSLHPAKVREGKEVNFCIL